MRITQSMLARVVLGQINRANQRIQDLNTMISTGRRIQAPSDDPAATRTILASRSRTDAIEAYQASISTGRSVMSVMEGALSSVEELIGRAHDLTLQARDASTSAEERQTIAQEIESLRASLLVAANTSIEGRYMFGGGHSTGAPYAERNGIVLYRGNDQSRSLRADDRETVTVTLSGRSVFAVHPAELSGSVDLNPALSDQTPLSDLHDGAGIISGAIQITDSSGASAIVDLASARDVGDVLTLINAAAVSVTASIRPDGSGIQIQDLGGGTTVTVDEVTGGVAASQLGIQGSAVGSIAGQDLDPRLALWNPLTLLSGGAGVSPGSILVDNSTTNDIRTATLDLSGVTTVTELIHAIDHAQSDQGTPLGLDLAVSDDGHSLVLSSTLSSSRLETRDALGGSFLSSLGLSGGADAQDLFNLFDGLADQLRQGEGDPQGRLGVLLDRLDTALEGVLSVRGELGVRMQHLDRIGTRLQTEANQVEGIIDAVEGTDLASAITDLTLAQTQYQATLSSGSRLISQSLLDYLG